LSAWKGAAGDERKRIGDGFDFFGLVISFKGGSTSDLECNREVDANIDFVLDIGFFLTPRGGPILVSGTTSSMPSSSTSDGSLPLPWPFAFIFAFTGTTLGAPQASSSNPSSFGTTIPYFFF